MHIGLIMDGNGRWATQRQLPRAAGHLEGLKACKRVVAAAAEMGIEYLTLYVFSTENWKRPEQEVKYLMNLLEKKLPGEINYFLDNGIRLKVRGDVSKLPPEAQESVKSVINQTAKCDKITVVLAINYGGQDEIARAVNKYIKNNPGKDISIADIEENLDNPDVPAPDIIVRSAGEMRLSNFMLWDSAYAEFLSIPKLWPDWDKEELEIIIQEYSKRNRKFGGLNC